MQARKQKHEMKFCHKLCNINVDYTNFLRFLNREGDGGFTCKYEDR